jgi:cytochrome c-type biogenesis protein
MDLFQPVFAFLLGLLSITTPCVLPIIPSYLAYLCGNQRHDLLKGSVVIFLGVSAGAVAIGGALSLIGGVTSSRWFYLVAALIVAFLLADTLFLRKIKPVVVGKELLSRKGLPAGFFYGLLIIFVASPCILPLLAITAVVTLTFTESFWRVLIMVFYALGLSLPFILLAAFSSKMSWFISFSKSRASHWIVVALLTATLLWLIWSFLTICRQRSGRSNEGRCLEDAWDASHEGHDLVHESQVPHIYPHEYIELTVDRPALGDALYPLNLADDIVLLPGIGYQ